MMPKAWLLTLLITVCVMFLYFYNELLQIEKKYRDLEVSYANVRGGQLMAFKNENDVYDDLIVIYNRVPKTGSTSFVGIAYDLCKKNAFKVIHLNITANMHIMSLNNQYKFALNVSKWDSVKPVLYHGHVAFLNFERLGMSARPIFINIIRKPLDRLVSYYYFLRNGDNFRPHLVRRKHGDKMTFDECVERGQSDCDPKNMWLQIPFFCGHSADCWKPGNKWALEEAKRNLINYYLLVGVTEEMLDFISLLELTLPRMFRGATEHYLSSNRSHLRQTSSKSPLLEKTISKIHKSDIWKMENELYDFALAQFRYIKKKTLQSKNLNNISQQFMFEKIRPK